jgi:lipoate-protein ligase A
MALDGWLLRRCEAGDPGSVLRLYRWDRPTISLGRHQDPGTDRIDLDRCRRLGVSVVRRPTGGRAVYHGPGLTYAVIAPIPRDARTVAETYRWVAAALLDGLRALGLPVSELGRRKRAAGPLQAACYAAPSMGEVALAGGKWIGSAQRRLHRAFLQHGAIPLCDDSESLAACLDFPDESTRRRWAAALSARTAPVAQHLGHLALDDLIAALPRGFERHHRITRWQPLDTSSRELAEAVAGYRTDPHWALVDP